MREIEFKGIRIDNGEWVYGNLIMEDDECYISTGPLGIALDEGYWANSYGYPPSSSDFHMGSGGSSTRYKPYVLSEYYQRRMEVIGNIHDKHQQKQALIDTMRGDEEIGLYDDNPKKSLI